MPKRFKPFSDRIGRIRKTRLEVIPLDLSESYLKTVELYHPIGVEMW